MEMHECIFSTVATDALVVKYQAISIHSADYIFILVEQFYGKILEKYGSCLRVNLSQLSLKYFHFHPGMFPFETHWTSYVWLQHYIPYLNKG